MKIPLPLLLTLLLLFGALPRVSVAVDSADGSALKAFYVQLDNTGLWTWNENVDPCGTPGISCNGEGKIIEINLGNEQLEGTIATEMGELTALSFLYLHGNKLSGNIPTEFGKLIALTLLSLDNNQLYGTIPTELGNLNNLIDLYLNNNKLNGTIPTELGELDKLQYLFLQSNALSGTIPSILETLPNLLYLYLASNELCYWTDYSDWATVSTDSDDNIACANCEVSCLNDGTCNKGNPSYICTCSSDDLILPNCTAPETTTETTTTETTTTESTTPTETTTATPTATPFVGCSAGNYDHANWPATGFGATATGTCSRRGFGSASSPTRMCLSGGYWSPKIKNRCLTLKCPLNGEWPMTRAGHRSTIPCDGGGPGEAHRWCGYDGHWIDPPVYYC